MKRLLDIYCRGLEIVIAVLLAIMVVLVFGNVVMRYGFNSGITVSEEVSRWMFVWLTFLGAIIALKEHGHLGSDMLVSKLPAVGKKVCLVLGQSADALHHLADVFRQPAAGPHQLDVSAPATGAPVAIIYSAGVVFAVSAAVILVRDLWLALSGQLSDAELVMIKESEEAGELEALQAELARENARASAPGRTLS